MSDDFAKLKTPEKIPPAVEQRIKDLKCPPPIKPSQVSVKINALNLAMQAQMNEIKLLVDQVNDLEKRYKISFSCKNNPKMNLQSQELPQMELGGNLTNLILDFRLWQAEAGIEGIYGDQGEQGSRGTNAVQGIQGISGYYGIRGDTK